MVVGDGGCRRGPLCGLNVCETLVAVLVAERAAIRKGDTMAEELRTKKH